MPRPTLTAVLAIAGLLASSTGFADSTNSAAESVSHRVILQGKERIAIVNAKGEVEWEVPCAFTSHDIAMLPNGHYLLHTGPATIVEMTPDKKVVWTFRDFERLGNDVAAAEVLDVRGDVIR
jgi:hypothetical protein